MPEYPASVRLTVDGQGSNAEGPAEAESVLTRLTCISRAVCQFCTVCSGTAECGSIQQALQRAGSGLTLGFMNSQMSGWLFFNSPEHCCITCDKSLGAFLAALQLQESFSSLVYLSCPGS